jgi:hypothetical protein
MKLKGHIAYDDAGNVVAFLENEAGQMMEVGTESVDWQRFDTPVKAKEAAAEKLRHDLAESLEAAALDFKRGRITISLT